MGHVPLHKPRFYGHRRFCFLFAISNMLHAWLSKAEMQTKSVTAEQTTSVVLGKLVVRNSFRNTTSVVTVYAS